MDDLEIANEIRISLERIADSLETLTQYTRQLIDPTQEELQRKLQRSIDIAAMMVGNKDGIFN